MAPEKFEEAQPLGSQVDDPHNSVEDRLRLGNVIGQPRRRRWETCWVNSNSPPCGFIARFVERLFRLSRAHIGLELTLPEWEHQLTEKVKDGSISVSGELRSQRGVIPECRDRYPEFES